MNRSVSPKRRRSNRKLSQKQLREDNISVNVSDLPTLPQDIKATLTSVPHLSFSKLNELAFDSTSSFLDNISLMKEAVEAQEQCIQKLMTKNNIKVQFNENKLTIKDLDIQYQRFSNRSRSRRKESEDLMADSKQIEILNPFHFQQNNEIDYFSL